jgi:hypothetical protein
MFMSDKCRWDSALTLDRKAVTRALVDIRQVCANVKTCAFENRDSREPRIVEGSYVRMGIDTETPYAGIVRAGGSQEGPPGGAIFAHASGSSGEEPDVLIGLMSEMARAYYKNCRRREYCIVNYVLPLLYHWGFLENALQDDAEDEQQ